MPELGDLPNETLDRIAGYLGNGALYNLALTSQKLAEVSRIILYKEVYLPGPWDQHDWEDRILFLARTLISRRDLATRITKLEVSLYQYHLSHRATIFGTMSNSIYDIVNDLPVPSTQRNNNWWMSDLHANSAHAWFGLVLYLVPRLETLALKFVDSVVGNPYYYSAGFFEIFDNEDIDVQRVPGLRNIKKLSLECKMASWDWLSLPSLKDLHLGKHVKIQPMDPDPWRPTLSSITCISHSLLDARRVFSNNATGSDTIFQHDVLTSTAFSTLRRVEIVLGDSSTPRGGTDALYRRIKARDDGCFTKLADLLAPLADTLEELYVRVHEGADARCTKHIDAMDPRGLAVFHNLKVLYVPQPLLLSNRLNAAVQDKRYPAAWVGRVLPTTLQVLTIQHPTLKIRQWLGIFMRYAHSYPHLRTVNFVVGPSYGEIFQNDDAPIWKEMCESGIQIALCNERGQRLVWDYDRTERVGDVVSWLESLHEPEDLTIGFTQFWTVATSSAAELYRRAGPPSRSSSLFQLRWIADKAELLAALTALTKRTE